MDIIFTNSESSKTFNPRKLILSPTDKKINSSDEYISFSNLNINYTQKNIITPYKNNTFKVSARTDQILYQIFKIISIIPSKNL